MFNQDIEELLGKEKLFRVIKGDNFCFITNKEITHL